MKKLLLALVIALALIASASAQENFDAYGQPSIDTFQCSMHEGKVLVINSGATSSTYFMEVEGSAAKWASFAPATFVLSPGQSLDVKSYLDVPCDAKGDYTLDIFIVTADGVEKAIPQDISIEKPQNIDIRANVFSQSINPCQTARYNLTIINPLDFTEAYSVSVDKFKNETFFSEEKLTIPGKSTRDIILDVEPEQCDISGDYNIIFSAKAEKTMVSAEMDLTLQINSTGIASIAPGVSKIKTDYTEKGVELEISNKGDSRTEYEVLAAGADWVSVEPETITVGAEKSEKFKLLFKPNADSKKGKYQIKIIAKADTGAMYKKEITVQLGEKTIIDTLLEHPIWAFNGAILFVVLILIIYFVAKKYTSKEAKLARAKSKAEKAKKKEELKKQRAKEKKMLELEKARQQRMKELEKKRKEAQLESERKKAIKKYDQQIKSEYKLIPKEDIVEGRKLPDRWLINLLLFIILLIIIGLAIKFRAFFLANKWYVLLGIIILAILLIIKWLGGINRVTARWKGLVLANEMLLVDVNWRAGLQQLSFALSSPSEKLRAVIKKGRTRHGRYFRPKDYVYQYFRAESSVDEIKESRFRFKVDKKWMLKRQINEDKIVLAVLNGDSYEKLKTVKETSDDKFVYYKANADCFGQFAIIGTTRAKERHKPSWIAWAVLAVLVLIAIIIGAKLLYEPEIQAKGIPMQAWDENVQQTIDLNKYFSDPDSDALNFTATKVSNIDVQINAGVAYLTPDYDWSGQRIVTFTADDGKGGVAQSNPVKLVVKKKIVPVAATGYMKYVLAGIIILIVLIAVLVLRKPVMKWLEEEEKDY